MTENRESESQARQTRLIELLSGSPEGPYEEFARQMREARKLLQEHIADCIQPRLHQAMKVMPQGTADDKQALARWLNGEMRSLGIAVRCPRTGEPAMLHADSSQKPHGRFQIELLDRGRGRHRTFTSVALPELTFCPQPGRREPLVEYWQRVRDAKRER